MERLRRISTLEEAKALSHPVRVEILRQLDAGPMTMPQVAKSMGIAPQKLYYHIGELERHGFVQVARTEQKGNLTESYYQVSARTFEFDRKAFLGLGEKGRQAIWEGVAAVLESTGQAFRVALETGQLGQKELTDLRSTHFLVKMPPEKLAQFQARLEEIIQDLRAESDEGTITANFGFVYFPLGQTAKTD